MITGYAVLWGAVLALHLLAMALWVGGMSYVLLVRPNLFTLDPVPRMTVQMQILKRFFFLVWHAMPVMLLTGWAMVAGLYGGFAALGWSVNTMQAIGIVMALLFLYVFFGPWRRMRRAIRPTPAMLGRIRGLIAVNLVLGILTVIVAALGHYQ